MKDEAPVACKRFRDQQPVLQVAGQLDEATCVLEATILAPKHKAQAQTKHPK